jgi:hypothetical protein
LSATIDHRRVAIDHRWVLDILKKYQSIQHQRRRLRATGKAASTITACSATARHDLVATLAAAMGLAAAFGGVARQLLHLSH